jgi:hypothetical protein
MVDKTGFCNYIFDFDFEISKVKNPETWVVVKRLPGLAPRCRTCGEVGHYYNGSFFLCKVCYNLPGRGQIYHA